MSILDAIDAGVFDAPIFAMLAIIVACALVARLREGVRT